MVSIVEGAGDVGAVIGPFASLAAHPAIPRPRLQIVSAAFQTRMRNLLSPRQERRDRPLLKTDAPAAIFR
jgi:hypothetical protein